MSVAAPRRVPEARTKPDRLAFKTAENTSGQLIALDEAEGIVTAIVSVTGTEDEVADIIVPGAYRETLTKRNPKVCWAHSWEHPIGRTLHVEEIMPGDSRLPSQTKDGKPWPAEAGALVATMQFNLRTREGKDAFEAVMFYSETGECEYSIGYQVPAGKSSRRDGVRYIKALDLYELSVVLFGAHTMTGTLSIKAFATRAREAKAAASAGHTPPKGVQDAARRGLELRKANGGKGGTEVGVARARDLSSGGNVSLDTVKRMASFFARHEADKSAEGWGSTSNPSPGYVAWMLWGGDAGKRWAESVVARQEKSGAGSRALARLRAVQSKAAPPFGKESEGDGKPETKIKPGVTKRDDLPQHDADTNLTTEDCTCGDLLVFDTANGWQRLDGSYGHEDGTTHSDHIEPPQDPDAAPNDNANTDAATDGADAAPGPAAPGGAPAKADADADGGKSDALPDFTDGVMVALYPDPAAADAIAQHIAGPDQTVPREELHVTLAYLGKTSTSPLNSDEMIQRLTDALEGETGLRGSVGGIGAFPASDADNGAPTWVPVDVPGLSLLRENVVNALGQDNVSNDHGFTPHMTIGWDLGVIEPIPTTPIKFTEIRVVYGDLVRTIPLGGLPESEDDDLDTKGSPGKRKSSDFETCPKCGSNEVSHLTGPDQPRCAKCGYHVALRKSEKALDLDLDAMSNHEVGSLTAAFARWDVLGLSEAKAEGGADRNRGGAEQLRRYWTTGEGGAKIGWGTSGDFTRCVALLDEHMPGRAEGYCANRHKEMTGMWPGDKNNKGVYDPSLDGEHKDVAGGAGFYPVDVADVKGFPRLAGSQEESADLIAAAVNEALRGAEVEDGRWEWDQVTVDGTYDDHLYVTRWRFAANERETFEMAYRFVDGGVEFGEPVPCELEVVPVRPDGDDVAADVTDLIPLADALDNLVGLFKSAHSRTEVKAGRVLSGKNERALREAVERLVAVLAQAGVKIGLIDTDDDDDDPNRRAVGDDRTPVDPRIDTETTSPSASTKSHPALGGEMGVEGFDLSEVEATLARLREGL